MAEWQQLSTKSYAVCQVCSTKRNTKDVRDCPVCEHKASERPKKEKPYDHKRPEIYRLRQKGLSCRAIGEKVGEAPGTVRYILTG